MGVVNDVSRLALRPYGDFALLRLGHLVGGIRKALTTGVKGFGWREFENSLYVLYSTLRGAGTGAMGLVQLDMGTIPVQLRV